MTIEQSIERWENKLERAERRIGRINPKTPGDYRRQLQMEIDHCRAMIQVQSEILAHNNQAAAAEKAGAL